MFYESTINIYRRKTAWRHSKIMQRRKTQRVGKYRGFQFYITSKPSLSYTRVCVKIPRAVPIGSIRHNARVL